jgi:hypothetical protein
MFPPKFTPEKYTSLVAKCSKCGEDGVQGGLYFPELYGDPFVCSLCVAMALGIGTCWRVEFLPRKTKAKKKRIK